MNLSIVVATHKKYWMPDDNIYLPLHVGKAGKESLCYLGDDTGDNISLKNANYCELTGLYWAWKNLQCEYVGLCHYRRYFCNKKYLGTKLNKDAILKKEDYERLLKNVDIILPKKYYLFFQSSEEYYQRYHYASDLKTVKEIISAKYPQYIQSMNIALAKHSTYLCNMFVMKKVLFDEYCVWLFDILFEAEKRIDISGYNKEQARVYGYLSERLFNIWLEYQNLRIKEVPLVILEAKPGNGTKIDEIIDSFRYKYFKTSLEKQHLEE